jgi:hypothetical protein
MSAKRADTTPMLASQVRGRAAQARDWLKNLDLVEMMHEDHGIGRPNNQIATAAIFAGIAAADAICGHHLGARSSSQDHAAAVDILTKAGPNGKSLSNDLRRLINEKSNVNYGDREISDTKRISLVRSARSLVEALDSELRL